MSRIEEYKKESLLVTLNFTIRFCQTNSMSENKRYVKVLKYQKSLIRDIEKQGRKVPRNIPCVCEKCGKEVNSIREKQPPFKLEENIFIHKNNPLIVENDYEKALNNICINCVYRELGRELIFEDLNNIEDNLDLIMEIMKHRRYYCKYFNLRSFDEQLENIEKILKKI
jgi:hypothetical protein